MLDAADVELGFNYPFPIVTQEVNNSITHRCRHIVIAAKTYGVMWCDGCNGKYGIWFDSGIAWRQVQAQLNI